MNYPPGARFHQEEGVELAKEEVHHWQEITGPALTGMVFKKGSPLLAGPWASRGLSLPHVFLDY
jgi:hypothetical protein